LDETRVLQLKALAHAINGYRLTHEALPESLADVVDGLRITSVPTDPVTDIPYEYSANPPQHYELCAEFERNSRREDAHDFWAHESGRQCYSFVAQDVRP
jgi:hypothetical protein